MEFTASVPLAACPTMSKPESSSIWTSILRTWAVSSTTNTRTDIDGSYTVPRPGPGPQTLRTERAEALQHRDEKNGWRPGRLRHGRGGLGGSRRRLDRGGGDRRRNGRRRGRGRGAGTGGGGGGRPRSRSGRRPGGSGGGRPGGGGRRRGRRRQRSGGRHGLHEHLG